MLFSMTKGRENRPPLGQGLWEIHGQKAWEATPKKAIILESLHSIRNILEGMIGSLLASQLLEHLSTLIH